MNHLANTAKIAAMLTIVVACFQNCSGSFTSATTPTKDAAGQSSLITANANEKSVVFYVVAHQDDWQLFMTANSAGDLLNSNAKVVFIVVTAGDDGKGAGGDGQVPYYVARNQGSEASARALAPNANVKFHFLNLPDGQLYGGGFPSTGNQSLLRLAAGECASLTAVDGSFAVNGWTQLIDKVDGIVASESVGGGRV